MNIVDLLQADGISPIHASRDEFHSACPECGGHDRFSSWPEKVNSNGRYLGGRFVCRGCGFHGDAVFYLMKSRAMTFVQAVKQLGLDAGPMPEHRTERRAWEPSPPKATPGAAWQQRGGGFMEACVEQLKRTSEAMTWLQAARGLDPTTIKWAGLGWNNVDVFQSRESWGLPPEVNQTTGKTKKVWLPSGLVIPCLDSAGQVVRIRTRRSEPGQGSRYVVVTGSDMRAMIQWQEQRAVCILESELDGLLVHQEAGDLIGVVALGSAQQRPDSDLHQRLMKAARILVCLDSDQAGAKESWQFWRQYPGFQRWPAIKGKDPGEMFKAGVPVRMWIRGKICG
jgi:hypothetical protein